MALHEVIDRIVEGFGLTIAVVIHVKGNDNGPRVSGTGGLCVRRVLWMEGWRNSQLMLNDLYPHPCWTWGLVIRILVCAKSSRQRVDCRGLSPGERTCFCSQKCVGSSGRLTESLFGNAKGPENL